MADPFSLALAAGASFSAMQELAGNLVPEFVGDLASPRERLKQLRERLNLARPDENHDLFRALTDAYWIALLLVVALVGEAAGEPVCWPEALGAGSTVTKAWRKVRELFPSGQSRVGLQNAATAEIALALYPKILEQLEDSLKMPPVGIEAAYAEVESLFVRSQGSAPEFARTLIGEAGEGLRRLAYPHVLTAGMEAYLEAHWFLLFRGALAETVKRNEEVERILNITLVSEIHQGVQTLLKIATGQAVRPIVRSNVPSMGKRPFLGREKLLEKIGAGLGDVDRESVAVLHGQPGVGKSEVAREFARRSGDRYSGGTFWVDASKGGLGLAFATIGKTMLNLAAPAGFTIEEQGQFCFQRLGAEPMLLIYDNVVRFEEIAEWLPVSGMQLHVLLTTFVVGDERAWDWIEVPLLTEEESVAVARELTEGRLSEEKCREIARFAGGLSIQVVSEAAATNVEMRRRRVPAVGAGIAPATGESFARPYALLDADARLLAHAVRYLSPQRIPIVEVSLHLCGGAGWDEDRFAKALDLCEDLHLVALDTHLSMHQLFARFLDGETLGAEEAVGLGAVRRRQWERFRELAGVVAANPAELEVVGLLVAYPIAVAGWRDILDEGQYEAGTVVGRALYEIGRFAESQPWFEEAVAKARLGDSNGCLDHDSLGRSLHLVGSCLSNRGQFAEAQPWFVEAVTEKRQGDSHGRLDHASLGTSLHQVGYCLSGRGQFAEAQPWFEKAVAEVRLGDSHGRLDHASLGRSLHQVGICLWGRGQFAEAQPWFEEAIAEKRQGDSHGRLDHENLGSSLNLVGFCLSSRGQFAEAQPWFEEAVAEKRQGDSHGRMDHESLSSSLHMVGYCLSSRGKFAEAQPWFEEAAAEARLGDVFGRVDHESLARSIDWVGICRAKLGDAVGAAEWRAMAAKERAL